MVDAQDCKAWLEKLSRSKRILQEVPVDSRGLYSGNLPTTFVRDPYDEPRHLDWTGSDPNWTGNGPNWTGSDDMTDDLATVYNVIASNGVTVDAPPSTPTQDLDTQPYHCYTAAQTDELDNSTAEHIRWFDQHVKQDETQRHQIQASSSSVKTSRWPKGPPFPSALAGT